MEDRKSSDIRERGIFNSNAMTLALEAQQRYDEMRAAERRRHQELYNSQFRVRRARPIGPKPNYRWWVCQRMGIDPQSDYEPRPFFRGTRDSPPPIAEEPESEIREMPPRTYSPVPSYPLWVLDAETLEEAYDDDVINMSHPVWSTEPYDNLWISVGLLLTDEEFQPVSSKSWCDSIIF